MRKVIRYAALITGILSLGATGIACASMAGQTQGDSQGQEMTSLDNESVSSLSSHFAVFAGSSTNAQDLINGLRSGSSITLNGTGQSSVTFAPPTSTMGNGEVAISLGLAQQVLASYGITNPTPQEIEAALVGGTITTSSGAQQSLSGVLTMRSSGMGWGEIAQKDGFKLGSIVSQIHETDSQHMSASRSDAGIGDDHASDEVDEHAHGDAIDAAVSTRMESTDSQQLDVNRPDVDVDRPQIERPQIERPQIERPDIQRPDLPGVDH